MDEGVTLDRGSPRSRAALALAVRRYLSALRQQGPLAVVALVAPALGNVLIFYIPPLVVARLVGRIATDGALPAEGTAGYVTWFAVSWFAGECLWRLGIHCLNRTDANGIAQLYVSGMDELLAKDLAFFHDSFGGSLTKRLVGYGKRFEEFVDTLSFQVVGNLGPLLVASVVLWRYSPLLVAILLSGIGLALAIAGPLIRRRQALVDAREAASALVAGHIADTVTNVDAVRTHAAEQDELAAHSENVARHRRLALRSWDFHNLWIDGAMTPIVVATNALGLLVVLRLASDGGLGGRDVEAILVVVAYFMQATRILFDFNQVYRNLESSLTEAAQFTELLLDPPLVTDPPAPEPLRPVDAAVRFESVSFRHPRERASLFEGLDLTIADGERVGLVGRSGGGKTTLTRLLLRLMDVDGGTIRIGGHDIAALGQADLRSLIAYVPQDPVLFHRSLRDNIAFGRPTATEDEIEAAARAAHAWEFIDQLSAGLDTLVGERGVKLSGGQRQRIAIARAIVRDAPVLVLDEATSALDSESEALIQDGLWRLMAGRTALVVAHRLSTVAQMDRLVVLDRGRVAESGPHEVLRDAGGIYAELWRRQSGGFLAEAAS